MKDANLSPAKRHLHTLTDQSPRHGIGIGVDLDRTVAVQLANQLPDLSERWPPLERLQFVGLVTDEARKRRFAGRTVTPRVGHLAQPPGNMPLECGHAGKAVPGQCIVLHVTNAALILARRPRPIRGTGTRPETPVAGEGVQPIVKNDLTRCSVMVLDQRPCVVDQHLRRRPAEVSERSLDAVEPR